MNSEEKLDLLIELVKGLSADVTEIKADIKVIKEEFEILKVMTGKNYVDIEMLKLNRKE